MSRRLSHKIVSSRPTPLSGTQTPISLLYLPTGSQNVYPEILGDNPKNEIFIVLELNLIRVLFLRKNLLGEQ